MADEAAATALENCVECAPEGGAGTQNAAGHARLLAVGRPLRLGREAARKAAKAKAAKEARLAQMRNPAPAAPAMTEEETMKMIQERPELYGCTAGRKP